MTEAGKKTKSAEALLQKDWGVVSGFLREHQKRCLKGIFRVVPVAENALAGSHHHGSVALNQLPESCRLELGA